MNEDVSHIINNLNEAQREAVTAELGNLLVLAGAGSGKTRVLVHRIAWLIAVEKLSPYNILAVTFTNKAAKEMQHRIEGMLGLPANNMWVGTFHGLAHRLLRAHWQEAGLPQHFQIIDSEDQHRLIKRIQRDMVLDESQWPPKQTQWFINKQKDNGRRSNQLPASNDHHDRVMKKVYMAYEETCEQGGLIDFAELLLRTFELLKNNAHILHHYQQRFQYVLVDEFQDTNTLQYDWLKLLVGKNSQLMIVGDDDQSIYSWRGAQVENIRRFEKDYKNVKTIRLEQNYRSTGNILTAANALIANNKDRLGKNLWTDTDEGELISIYAAFNDLDEARFIVDRIKKWKESNSGDLKDCAILYRSNAQSRILEEAFLQAGLPYRIYGGLRFYERAEIKDALAYLRVIDNRDNNAALERIINTPTRGIGNRTVMTLREVARNEQLSLWQAAKKIIQEQLLPSRALTALATFIDLINHLDTRTDEKELPDQIEYVIRTSGLLDHYLKEKGEKARARIENLEELVNAARQFLEEDIEEDLTPITAFLAHSALEAGEGQAGQFDDCAQLMTLHAAKGLEFPLVFLAGMEETLFPHQMSMEDPKGLLEERRLCYVGMTRAMRKLYLCHAEVRALYGQERHQSPSRFLYEIPAECCEEVRMRSRVSLPFTHSKRVSQTTEDQNGNSLFVGQSVNHGKFGAGVILKIEGSGPKARLHVNFNQAGAKWLMAEYAKLEPV